MPDEKKVPAPPPDDAATYTVTEDQSITRADGSVITLKAGDELPISHARELGLAPSGQTESDADDEDDADAEPPQ